MRRASRRRAFLAARERAHGRTGAALVEQEVLEVGHDVAGRAPHHDLVRAAAPERWVLGQAVPERGVPVERGARLVEDGDLQVRAVGHGARVGRLLAQEEPHERGLARAVGADDGEPVAALHDEVEAPDDGLAVGLREAARDDHPPCRRWARRRARGRRSLSA
jgi:hypothetical protein